MWYVSIRKAKDDLPEHHFYDTKQEAVDDWIWLIEEFKAKTRRMEDDEIDEQTYSATFWEGIYDFSLYVQVRMLSSNSIVGVSYYSIYHKTLTAPYEMLTDPQTGV